MTARSIILGLLGAVVISAACYFNDEVIRQGALVPDLMPVVVYGPLVFFLLFLNPLLRRIRADWVLSRRELAVATCMVLAACAIPSWGLVQCLPTSVMMPHHFSRVNPGWQEEDIIAEAPRRMLADVSNEDQALDGYVAGLGEGDTHIPLSRVPWYAWRGTLLFWVPLMICSVAAVLGLAVVVHRQWVHHEQIPYPISVFAHALLPEEGEPKGAVFRNRLFLVGALSLFAIHTNNYLCRYWPNQLIPIREYLDFTPLAPLFPNLVRGTGMLLLRPRIFFSVIALAYFIPSDVSFSMATIPFIFCYIQGVLAGYGILLRTGDHLAVKLEAYLFTGGYLGILLMLLYTGRRYYSSVLARAVGIRTGDPVPGQVLWAMRTSLIATALFILSLVGVGLDWQLAVLYTGLALMIFVVVARTIAETGAFHIGSEIFPGAILLGVFGAAALGPRTIIIMFLLSAVLMAAPGWSTMPFVVQGFKLIDMAGVNPTRIWKTLSLTLLLCLAIALPLTLYWQYDRGVPGWGWPRSLSEFPFSNLVTIKQRLASQGTLEAAREVRGWQRFAHMRPNGPCMLAFGIALTAALGIGFARLRFARWPFHPVVFVFLGGYQAKLMAGAFLIGWVIKALVNRYGGGGLYRRLRPLMVGIIAGEMAARLVPTVVGTIYYLVTGDTPR